MGLISLHAPGGQCDPVFGRVVNLHRLTDAVEAERSRELDILLARVLMHDRPEGGVGEMWHACLGVTPECRLVNNVMHVIQPETLVLAHGQRLTLNAADAPVNHSALIVQWSHERSGSGIVGVVPKLNGGLNAVELGNSRILDGIPQNGRRHGTEQQDLGTVLVVALEHRHACLSVCAETLGILDVDNVIDPIALHGVTHLFDVS